MHFRIIDAHAHCGIQDLYPPQSLEDYLDHVRGSEIRGAVFIPPVFEIYDRYDPYFEDNAQWVRRRQSANSYLLSLGGTRFEVFPFFFIWNDFAVEEISEQHKGIKWHRHPDEPVYHYDDPRCSSAIREIRRRNLPVCLEEEFGHTLRFIRDLAPGMSIIIPHCGLLNGGYEGFVRAGIWELPNIHTDTSLVPSSLVGDYVQRYGHSRIMFGSDFPFGDPVSEMRKIQRMGFPEDVKQAILGQNVIRLLGESPGEGGPDPS